MFRVGFRSDVVQAEQRGAGDRRNFYHARAGARRDGVQPVRDEAEQHVIARLEHAAAEHDRSAP